MTTVIVGAIAYLAGWRTPAFVAGYKAGRRNGGKLGAAILLGLVFALGIGVNVQ